MKRALETVHLGGYGTRRTDELSGGQRQRVALARAIVFEPRILLMDEPLSALDKKLREAMQLEIRALHDRLGMTTIYVTHDQREALTMSDRIAVINRGRVEQVETPQMLYEAPNNRFVADFIGESSFLPVELAGERITCFGRELHTATNENWRPGDRLSLLIRPERLRLLQSSEVDPMVNILPATLETVIYQGDSYLMLLKLEDGSTVQLRGIVRQSTFTQLPPPGSKVQLGLDAQDTVVLHDA